MNSESKKIIFSGGGTLGPVMPLLAVYQELYKNNPQRDFLWVGTNNGPEINVVSKYGIKFSALPESKFRRYWSWKNLADFFKFFYALYLSIILISKYQPDILISAGGFVSVPLHLAAFLMKKKTIIHQQDVVMGLANRIMALTATYISVSLPRQIEEFPKHKTIYLGNPVREGLSRGSAVGAIKNLLLDPGIPTILVLGGGTGAMSLNKVMAEIMPRVVEMAQVVHMTGKGKDVVIPRVEGRSNDLLLKERYHPVQFLDEVMLADVLALVDIVICRAGFSSLTELAVLGKAMIIAPIPNSHQVANAEFFAEKCGVQIYNSDKESANVLLDEITHLINDPRERIFMGRDLQKIMPNNARQRMAELVEEVVKKNN